MYRFLCNTVSNYFFSLERAMDDQKPFAIVVDESKKKIVVPSNWLSNDCQTLYWPTAITDPFKLKKAIISCKTRANGWQEYDVTRFIKYKGKFANFQKNNSFKLLLSFLLF